jgi:hypothetical protein
MIERGSDRILHIYAMSAIGAERAASGRPFLVAPGQGEYKRDISGGTQTETAGAVFSLPCA